MPIEVRVLDGEVRVCLPVDVHLAQILSEINVERVRLGRLPAPKLQALTAALRDAATLAELLALVPPAEPNTARNTAAGQGFTVNEAAKILNVTARAVRKRIAAGQLQACRGGREWIIAPESLGGTGRGL
jgi:excisionase family DNA binding protein